MGGKQRDDRYLRGIRASSRSTVRVPLLQGCGLPEFSLRSSVPWTVPTGGSAYLIDSRRLTALSTSGTQG